MTALAGGELMATQITAERLHQILTYNPGTGDFVWRERASGRARVGCRAGSIDKRTGYLRIGIDGSVYQSHRLAWLWMTGAWPPELDHMDGNKRNNQWANLRVATKSQNGANRGPQANNKLGRKGVSFHTPTGRYHVRCGKRYVGLYKTIDEASAAYQAAAQKIYGEFASF